MVFFNYATMQMAAKIVYYGPGLCGKTTNLHCIYGKTSPQSRGEMVSLETETDRTLFFDLLPIDVGVIGGFKTRLQLYTIPGQVFYNTTRKLVLKGVDGIVFVADSQKQMVDANTSSFHNLRENLAEIGLNLDDLPVVIQLNKRDLPNIADKQTLLAALDPAARYDFVEASAVTGQGVFETLTLISKLTLRMLRRRMTGEEPRTTLSVRSARPSTATAPPTSTSGSTRRARKETPEIQLEASRPPVQISPASPSQDLSAAASTAIQTQTIETTVESAPNDVFKSEPSFKDSMLNDVATVGANLIATAPIPEADSPFTHSTAAEDTIEPVKAPTEAPKETLSREPATPPVKHVRVRSSVDVMAELESLRKRATQSPSKPKKQAQETSVAIPREVQKTVALRVAKHVLSRAAKASVNIVFEDGAGATLGSVTKSVDTDAGSSGVKSLLLNLQIRGRDDE